MSSIAIRTFRLNVRNSKRALLGSIGFDQLPQIGPQDFGQACIQLHAEIAGGSTCILFVGEHNHTYTATVLRLDFPFSCSRHASRQGKSPCGARHIPERVTCLLRNRCVAALNSKLHLQVLEAHCSLVIPPEFLNNGGSCKLLQVTVQAVRVQAQNLLPFYAFQALHDDVRNARTTLKLGRSPDYCSATVTAAASGPIAATKYNCMCF